MWNFTHFYIIMWAKGNKNGVDKNTAHKSKFLKKRLNMPWFEIGKMLLAV